MNNSLQNRLFYLKSKLYPTKKNRSRNISAPGSTKSTRKHPLSNKTLTSSHNKKTWYVFSTSLLHNRQSNGEIYIPLMLIFHLVGKRSNNNLQIKICTFLGTKWFHLDTRVPSGKHSLLTCLLISFTMKLRTPFNSKH